MTIYNNTSNLLKWAKTSKYEMLIKLLIFIKLVGLWMGKTDGYIKSNKTFAFNLVSDIKYKEFTKFFLFAQKDWYR